MKVPFVVCTVLAVVGGAVAQCPVGYKLSVWENKCLCRSGSSGSNMRIPDRSCAYKVEDDQCFASCPKTKWAPGRGGMRGGKPQDILGGVPIPPSDCPEPLQSCPISPIKDLGFECITPSEDLDNCGGCVSLGKGVACTSLPGSEVVECNRGLCKIRSCKRGYRLDAPANECIHESIIRELLNSVG